MEVVYVANQPSKSIRQLAEDACFEQGFAKAEDTKAAFMAGAQFRSQDDNSSMAVGFFLFGLLCGGAAIWFLSRIF